MEARIILEMPLVEKSGMRFRPGKVAEKPDKNNNKVVSHHHIDFCAMRVNQPDQCQYAYHCTTGSFGRMSSQMQLSLTLKSIS